MPLFSSFSSQPLLPLLSSALSSGPLILRRCHHPHNRHPPLPRPRTYFSSYFIFICFPPLRPLAPLFLLLFLSSSSPPRTAPSPRTSFRIIFILSSAILVNAIPPAVRETFFILRLNILSRYRAVETSRLEGGKGRGGEEGEKKGGRGKGTTPRNPRWRSTLLPSDKDTLGLAFDRRGMSSSELKGDSLARYYRRKHILFTFTSKKRIRRRNFFKPFSIEPVS